jgi:uncharacterized membrane protein
MIAIAVVCVGVVLAIEVVQWGYTLAVHAHWMTKHKEEMICWNLSPRMAFIAAVMAGMLSVFVMAWAIWVTVLGTVYVNILICGVLALGLHLSHIHFMALLGRCVEIPFTLWPPISKMVSKYIVRRHPCTHIKLALRDRRRGDKK